MIDTGPGNVHGRLCLQARVGGLRQLAALGVVCTRHRQVSIHS